MRKLTFLGAVGTVTGSKYLLTTDKARVLIDCGLFQGFKQLRLRNWAPPPMDPHAVDAVLLTHAHLDHSGYLPLFVRNGFKGPVFATSATRDLCAILLPDSGFLQEKDAEFANRHGYSKHRPALPLYTEEDARRSLSSFHTVEFGKERAIADGMTARFLPAGHILGASIIEVRDGQSRIVFSGDLGRPHSATMADPTVVDEADYLIIESTYGDQRHRQDDPEDALLSIIDRTTARRGSILIPSFAVGRAQTLLYHLYRLKAQGRLGNVPVYLDSPMAIDASDLFRTHPADHKLSPAEWRAACAVAHYVHTAEESKELDREPMPKIIISASGMATGGRVLHHIKHMASDHRNTILFTGFQAGGTRGAAMVGGAPTVKIHGEYIPIRAEVHNLQMLSAHADADEILAWLKNFRGAPRQTFITHGEPAASDALRRRIEEELRWPCAVPDYRDEVDLL